MYCSDVSGNPRRFVAPLFSFSVLSNEGNAERGGTHPEAASYGVYLAGDGG